MDIPSWLSLKASSAEDAFYVLEAAQSAVFIPGYGMAVAQAQHVVKELAETLENNGAEVRFAIHPVAGRMPGHMNVLLVEADVPFEQLCEMDQVNPIIGTVDVAIVIGANDVVHPAALNDPGSPIYGMPIINAHHQCPRSENRLLPQTRQGGGILRTRERALLRGKHPHALRRREGYSHRYIGYVRRVMDGKNPFSLFWSDGNPDKIGASHLFFGNIGSRHVVSAHRILADAHCCHFHLPPARMVTGRSFADGASGAFP